VEVAYWPGIGIGGALVRALSGATLAQAEIRPVQPVSTIKHRKISGFVLTSAQWRGI
jgi:hypothetical protein